MHVELHYSIRPRVDVHIGVVTVGDRGHGIIHVAARVSVQAYHIDESTALDDSGGACRPVSVTGHVQIVRGRHSDGWLESGHPNSEVGAYSTDRFWQTLIPREGFSRCGV